MGHRTRSVPPRVTRRLPEPAAAGRCGLAAGLRGALPTMVSPTELHQARHPSRTSRPPPHRSSPRCRHRHRVAHQPHPADNRHPADRRFRRCRLGGADQVTGWPLLACSTRWPACSCEGPLGQVGLPATVTQLRVAAMARARPALRTSGGCRDVPATPRDRPAAGRHSRSWSQRSELGAPLAGVLETTPGELSASRRASEDAERRRDDSAFDLPKLPMRATFRAWAEGNLNLCGCASSPTAAGRRNRWHPRA
jgi:hypothetical protein